MANDNAILRFKDLKYYDQKMDEVIEELNQKIESGGYEIDTDLSDESENPVQNKAITGELNKKINTSDLADWAKAEDKPEYTYVEVGADPVGSASAAKTEANTYTDESIAALINGAPTTLDTLKEIADAMAENEDVVEALEAAIGNKANKDEIPTSLPADGGNADTLGGLSANKFMQGLGVITSGDIKEIAIALTHAGGFGLIGNAVTGMPTDGAYWYVSIERGSTSYVRVIATRITTNETYMMTYNSGTTTWTNWISTADGGNPATLAINPTQNTLLYPTFVDSNNATAAAEQLKSSLGYRVSLRNGTTDQTGFVTLALGNGNAEGTNSNQYGALRLYTPGTKYIDLIPGAANSSANFQIKLPTSAGTLALNTAATSSANGLMPAADKAKSDITNIAYGTCSTAAATAAKVVTIDGNTNWKLNKGSIIVVKFTATNTAQNPTLNVNNTGAKSVIYNTSTVTTSALATAGKANVYIMYMYNGSQYVFMGWSLDMNTTYGAASTTANGLVTTGTQTFAGAKTFNGVVKAAGASATNTEQLRNIITVPAASLNNTSVSQGTIIFTYDA